MFLGAPGTISKNQTGIKLVNIHKTGFGFAAGKCENAAPMQIQHA